MTSNQMERRTFLALLSAIGLSAADADDKMAYCCWPTEDVYPVGMTRSIALPRL